MQVHAECGRHEAHVGSGRAASRGSAGEQGGLGLLAVEARASTPRGLGWRWRRGQAGTCRGQAQVLQNRDLADVDKRAKPFAQQKVTRE